MLDGTGSGSCSLEVYDVVYTSQPLEFVLRRINPRDALRS